MPVEAPLTIQPPLPFLSFSERKVYSDRLKIGDTASKVVGELLFRYPEISRLFFVSYDCLNPYEDDIHPFAIPAHETSLEVLEGVASHFNRENETEAMAIAICSTVELQDCSYANVPMIDFCCRVEDQNLTKIVKILEDLGETNGVVLNSGNSYHYWGLRLLPANSLERFVTRVENYTTSTHLNPFDETFLHFAHDEKGALRIFSVESNFHDEEFSKPEPVIVKII